MWDSHGTEDYAGLLSLAAACTCTERKCSGYMTARLRRLCLSLAKKAEYGESLPSPLGLAGVG